jgi:ElaB/YqjD/DUF883 family membrane-anchored ribosome-binding protein
MDVENNTHEAPKPQMAAEPDSGSANAQSTLERRAEVHNHAQPAASDGREKAARVVRETYGQVKIYSRRNPGKTILIALGVGVGLGILLGANSRHSRTGRFARPVVNALSEIALEIFR